MNTYQINTRYNPDDSNDSSDSFDNEMNIGYINNVEGSDPISTSSIWDSRQAEDTSNTSEAYRINMEDMTMSPRPNNSLRLRWARVMPMQAPRAIYYIDNTDLDLDFDSISPIFHDITNDLQRRYRANTLTNQHKEIYNDILNVSRTIEGRLSAFKQYMTGSGLVTVCSALSTIYGTSSIMSNLGTGVGVAIGYLALYLTAGKLAQHACGYGLQSKIQDIQDRYDDILRTLLDYKTSQTMTIPFLKRHEEKIPIVKNIPTNVLRMIRKEYIGNDATSINR